jgi:mannose-6-phosphate isomerase-like protein (cupin superfamily)
MDKNKPNVFKTNIEHDTLENDNYRKVIGTFSHMQIVLMSLNVGETIPNEIHETHDQFFRIEHGKCEIIISGNPSFILSDGDVIVIPAKTYHEVKNIGNDKLKLYTIYAPPEHPEGTIKKRQIGGNDNYYKDKYLKYKSKYMNSK